MKKVLSMVLVLAMIAPMLCVFPVFATEPVTYRLADAFTAEYAAGDADGTYNDGDHIWTIGYFDPTTEMVTPYPYFGSSSANVTAETAATWGTAWRSGYENTAVDYATTAVLYGSMGISATRISCGFTPGMEADAHYYPTAVFTAPETGLYVFDGGFYRGGSLTRQDGHLLRVMKRTAAGTLSSVWPAGTGETSGDGSTGWYKALYAADTLIPRTAVELAAGDELLLMIDRNGNQYSDEYSIQSFDIEQVSGIPTYEKTLYTASYFTEEALSSKNVIDLSLPHLDGSVVYTSSDETLLKPHADHSGKFDILGASHNGGSHSSPFSTPVTVTATHTASDGTETVRTTTVHTVAYTAQTTDTTFTLDSFADIAIDGTGVWEILHEQTSALSATGTNYLKTPLALRNNGSVEYYQYITATASTYRPHNSEIFAANNQNVVMAFTIPYEGYWEIPSANVVCHSGGASDAHPNWDGVYAAIRTDDALLWPESENYNEYNYVEAQTTVATTAIGATYFEAGDHIYFVLNPGKNSYGDTSSWKPTVNFVAPKQEEAEPLLPFSIWDAFTAEYAAGDEDGTYNDGAHTWTIGAFNGTTKTMVPYTKFGAASVGGNTADTAAWGMTWKEGYDGTVVNISDSAVPYYGTIGVSKSNRVAGFTAGFSSAEHYYPTASFLAPRTGLYTFSGSMRRSSSNTAQDGHLVKVAKMSADGTVTSIWPGEPGISAADGTTGWQKANYGTDTEIPFTAVTLTAGDKLMLLIDRNGNQYSDEFFVRDFEIECIDTIGSYREDFSFLTHYTADEFSSRNVVDFSVLINPFATGTITYSSSDESVLKPHADNSGLFDIVGASHNGATYQQTEAPAPVTVTATYTPLGGGTPTLKTTTVHVTDYALSATDTSFTLDAPSDIALDGNGYWKALYETRTNPGEYQAMPAVLYEPDTRQYICYQTEANSRYRFNIAEWIPVMTENVVMAFEIPYSGYWDIPAANVVCNTGIRDGWDGINVAIRTDDEVLWPANGGADDFYYVEPSATVQSPAMTKYLEMGTHLYFVVSAGDSQSGDSLTWKPSVVYNETLNTTPDPDAAPITDYDRETYYLRYYTATDSAYKNVINLARPVTPGIAGDIRYTSSDETILKPVSETSGRFEIVNYSYNGGATKNFPDPVTVTATFTALDGTETVQTTKVHTLRYAIGENDISYELAGSQYMSIDNEGLWQVYYENTADLTATGTTYRKLPVELYTYVDGHQYFRFWDSTDILYRPDNTYMRPSATENLVLAFVAPKDGRYIVPSTTMSRSDATAADDIAYAIRTDSQTLIPANGAYNDFVTVSGSDAFATQATEVSLKQGEKLYFVINAGTAGTKNNLYYKPKVTVNPSPFEPNPLGITAYENIAPISVLADYGTEHLDSLQLGVAQAEATVSVSGNSSGSAAGFADAASDRNIGTSVVFADDGTVTATFDTARELSDMTMFLTAAKGVGSTYCIEFYYSEDGSAYTHFYTAMQTEEEGTLYSTAYPIIRLSDLAEKLPAVKSIQAKFILTGFFENDVTVTEWDINTATESTAVVAARTAAQSVVRLPSLYASGMILQRDADIKISGYGGTSSVRVTLKDANGATVSETTVPVTDYTWSATLPQMPGGHDQYAITVSDTQDDANAVTIDQILFGDLWVAGGQSNMSFSMQMIDSYMTDREEANFDEIRFFMQTEIGSAQQVTDPLNGTWSSAIGSNIAGWSAVAYHYAKTLYEGLDKEIPIGVLKTSIGATGAEAWMSEEALMQDDLFASLNNFHDLIGDCSKEYYERRAVAGFNAMTYPLTQLNVKGAIWYQGEANSRNVPTTYETLLRRLIACWRDAFGNEKMPFHVVQLSAYNEEGSDWMSVREAQLQVSLTDPNVGLAVTMDVGNKTDIHPTNKKPVGQRLGAAALAKTYGQNIAYSGPIVDTVTQTDNGVILTFTHDTEGLVAKDSDTLNGFELSTDGVTYTAATATIVDDTVVVTGLADAAYVRYGWSVYPEPVLNFYNGAGFMASPFRAKAGTVEYTLPTVTRENGTVTVSGSFINENTALMQPAILVMEKQENGTETVVRVMNPKIALYETASFSETIPDSGREMRLLFWEDLINIRPVCAPITVE